MFTGVQDITQNNNDDGNGTHIGCTASREQRGLQIQPLLPRVEFGREQEAMVDVILNKEVRADSSFFGVCEAVLEASGNCVVWAWSSPALSVLLGMLLRVLRCG